MHINLDVCEQHGAVVVTHVQQCCKPCPHCKQNIKTRKFKAHTESCSEEHETFEAQLQKGLEKSGK